MYFQDFFSKKTFFLLKTYISANHGVRPKQLNAQDSTIQEETSFIVRHNLELDILETYFTNFILKWKRVKETDGKY